MIHHEYIADLNLQYFYCVEPFDLDSLIDRIRRIAASPGPEGNLNAPTLYDLRSVDVQSMTAAQFHRFIRRRLELGSGSTGNPCAFVVGDMVSFGMIRMYGAMAEYRGLRGEDQSFVTTAMGEATGWVHQCSPNLSKEQVRRIVAQAEERGLATAKARASLVRQHAFERGVPNVSLIWRAFSRTFS